MSNKRIFYIFKIYNLYIKYVKYIKILYIKIYKNVSFNVSSLIVLLKN